jgi:hypothetical protein
VPQVVEGSIPWVWSPVPQTTKTKRKN